MRYVFEAVAITLVFTKGAIFKRVRESGPALWRELAACPLCAGVWVGMIWRVVRALPEVQATALFAEDVLAAGALTGVVALVVALFVGVLDRWS